MVEDRRGKDKDPKESLGKAQENFKDYFKDADRRHPQSAWSHALSDLCDYYDQVINSIAVGNSREQRLTNQELSVTEGSYLAFVNRKSFGNDQYGIAHKALFKSSAVLIQEFSGSYGGKGAIAKTRRFIFNIKNDLYSKKQ